MRPHALGSDLEGRMQRIRSEPWVWADPKAEETSYAVMKWKGGSLYAGPAESALNFPPALVEGASMLICPRAEALRHALNGKIEA